MTLGSSLRLLMGSFAESISFYYHQYRYSKTITPQITVLYLPSSNTRYELDGRIGLDVVFNFDYMLLDFKNMRLSLGNNKK